jgi:hypothetical protein
VSSRFRQTPTSTKPDTSTILINANIVSFPPDKDASIVEKILGRTDPLKDDEQVIISADQADELTKAFKQHRVLVSSPDILLKNYGYGSISIGQSLPIRLPNADKPDEKTVLEFPVGVTLLVKARIAEDQKSVALLMEPSVTKLMDSKQADRITMQQINTLVSAKIPTENAMLIKLPGKVSQFVGYRELIDPATNEKVVDIHEEPVKDVSSTDSVFMLIKPSIKK